MTVVRGGVVFAPEPRGPATVVLASGRVLALGDISDNAATALTDDVTWVDASGALVLLHEAFRADSSRRFRIDGDKDHPQ